MTCSTHRTFRFPARLSRTGHARLETVLGLLTDLYNAGLEHRVGAYRRQRQSVSYFDQCKQITALRREDPEVSAIDVRVLRSPLNRLNKAFGAFFRRVRKGERPGFPRYRSKRRYRGFEIDDNPRSVLKRNGKRARIRIKGLPPIGFKTRRELPDLERLQTVRIVWTARRIEVQLVFEIDVPEPIRIEEIRHPVGVDWGGRFAADSVDRRGRRGPEARPKRDPPASAQAVPGQARLQPPAEATSDARPGLAAGSGTQSRPAARAGPFAGLEVRWDRLGGPADPQPGPVRQGNERSARNPGPGEGRFEPVDPRTELGDAVAVARRKGRKRRSAGGLRRPAPHLGGLLGVRTESAEETLGPGPPVRRVWAGTRPRRERGEERLAEGLRLSTGRDCSRCGRRGVDHRRGASNQRAQDARTGGSRLGAARRPGIVYRSRLKIPRDLCQVR